jgi:hypothetical protein
MEVYRCNPDRFRAQGGLRWGLKALAMQKEPVKLALGEVESFQRRFKKVCRGPDMMFDGEGVNLERNPHISPLNNRNHRNRRGRSTGVAEVSCMAVAVATKEAIRVLSLYNGSCEHVEYPLRMTSCSCGHSYQHDCMMRGCLGKLYSHDVAIHAREHRNR